ncbi:MAG TPA: hypothetical protein VH723_02975 [Candidatus Limnocylindrales bacterium]|jgi:hypothetical protein
MSVIEASPVYVVTPRAAARVLADWGFLARPNLPERAGPAFLLVAVRDRPTLRHYDPESIEFWTSVDGRGTPRLIDRFTRLPMDEPFAWGEIVLTDRLRVRNEYLAFGGRLRAERVDDAAVAVFESTAPILARGGHSQRWDSGAEQVAAFFGRLLLAVDVVPTFEARLAAAPADTIYAAFLRDAQRRYAASDELRRADPELSALFRTEARRIARERPLAWAAGDALLEGARQDLRPV